MTLLHGCVRLISEARQGVVSDASVVSVASSVSVEATVSAEVTVSVEVTASATSAMMLGELHSEGMRRLLYRNKLTSQDEILATLPDLRPIFLAFFNHTSPSSLASARSELLHILETDPCWIWWCHLGGRCGRRWQLQVLDH